MSRPKRKNSTSEDVSTTTPATKRARPERNGVEKSEKPEKAAPARRIVKASSSAANLEPKKAPAKKEKPAKASSEPNLASKPNGKTSPRTAAPPPPSLHSLPTPPEHARPCYRVYTTGANDFGMQGFGMAPGAEMGRTKLGPNRLVDEAAAAGAYGDEPGAGFEAIAASGFHTVFVDEVGKVWTVGANDNGALGRDTLNVKDPATKEIFSEREAQAIPGVVQALADQSFRAVKIAASNSAVAAVSDKGEIRVWGSFRGDDHKFLGMAGLKEKLLPVPLVLEGAKARDRHHVLAVDAAAGAEHFVFLSTQGEVYTCGAGHLGQLGRRVLARGSRQVQGTNPQHIVLGSGRGAGRKAMLIRAGGHMSFAVDASGDTWAWGINGDGQTGTGLVDDQNDLMVSAPKKVLGLSKEELGGATVVDIAGGAMHAVFLTSDGRLFACGAVDSGRLGLASDHPALADKPRFLDHPTEIPWPDPEDKPVQLSATTDGTMARTEHGALYSWGSSPAIGELGFGKDEDEEAILTSETPKRIVKKAGGPLACVAVACGAQHSVTLMKARN